MASRQLPLRGPYGVRRAVRTCLVLVLLAFFVASAPDAWAHGGTFRQDPPPAPVPSGPPPSAPPSIPGTPSITPGTRGPRYATQSDMTWWSWWLLNSGALLPDRRIRIDPRAVTPSEGGAKGEEQGPPPEIRVYERQAVQLAYPFLLSLLRPEERVTDGVRGSALIAAARIARDATILPVLERYARDPDQSLEVRESAVLGLGLLRRTEPWRRLDLAQLNRVRELLLALYDEERSPMRVRAFAILSIGLLSDQPYGDDSWRVNGRLITYALWKRLVDRRVPEECSVALLTALGLQPREGVPEPVHQALREAVLRRRLAGRLCSDVERAHALTTLVRLGAEDASALQLRILDNRRQPDVLRSAALIGFEVGADVLSSDERVSVVGSLLKRIRREDDWELQGIGLIAVGSLLAADLAAGSDAVLEETEAVARLSASTRRSSTQLRPFAAIALGVAAHDAQPTTRARAEFLHEAGRTFAWGLVAARGPDEVLGAYAVGAGLARSREARAPLLDILQDRGRASALRGHAALALGQIEADDVVVQGALIAALRERFSSFVHLQAIRALACLDTNVACPELLRQLHGENPSRSAAGAIAAALGHLGDTTATKPLIDLARNQKTMEYVREMTIVALGLLFDPEPRPSITRLTRHANYRALTDSLAQAVDIM